MSPSVRPTPDEIAADLVGDEIVPRPDVVMDRAFTLDADPETVWPWFLQLGKRRAGWYLPRSVERLLPPARRGRRIIVPTWLGLAVGDVIPDWGGAKASFEAAIVTPPSALVYRSRRGRTELSWAIVLTDAGAGRTRVQLRLRLQPVRHVRLARSIGGFFDWVTVLGLAAGLRERLA